MQQNMRTCRSMAEMRICMIGFLYRRFIEMGQDRIVICQVGFTALEKDTVTIENNSTDSVHGRSFLRQMNKQPVKPKTTIGSESSWPIVAPPQRKPRCASGCRTNSIRKRNNP